ncbi:NUDIX domain-containing protein [Streptomyces sp. URMC 123]|uniref:NUDIX domain-containing protein n=1 Tax=Streptomyces sp. URMC 123 TaxID=3423403 RepID=UPI003F1A523E
MSENSVPRPAPATKIRPRVQVVAGIVRSGDEILLVREVIANEGPLAWSLPGGGVKAGELIDEAMRRELREETGLEVGEPEGMAFVVHHDTPAYPSAILCGLEYRSWRGEIAVADPSGDIVEARFFPIEEAMREMAATTGLPHHQPVVEYLSGRAPAGTAWLYRRVEGGEDQLVSRIAPVGPAAAASA